MSIYREITFLVTVKVNICDTSEMNQQCLFKPVKNVLQATAASMEPKLVPPTTLQTTATATTQHPSPRVRVMLWKPDKYETGGLSRPQYPPSAWLKLPAFRPRQVNGCNNCQTEEQEVTAIMTVLHTECTRELTLRPEQHWDSDRAEVHQCLQHYPVALPCAALRW